MKTIGLLGGTGWSSTIEYYARLNKLVNKQLGGYHSAKIILKSIDYHSIMNTYGKNDTNTADILLHELTELVALKPECIIICCNSLHKYYDIIKNRLITDIPFFHAVELTAQEAINKNLKNILLLATRFTMEDGFFAKTLEQHDIHVTTPNQEQRDIMQSIHTDLMNNNITEQAKNYFSSLIATYKHLDAVVLGCTEYPLVVNNNNSILPIIDPVKLQTAAAVKFALNL